MKQLKIKRQLTNRDSVSVSNYLQEINKFDLLTPEEEARLAQRIRSGDDEALEELVRANLRFVVSVAKQYQNNGLSLSDLINEGNVGLIKAARRFDETKGFKFISYAVWWIRNAILNAIVEYSRLVRIPSGKISAYSKVNRAVLNFVQEYEREPSKTELVEILGLSEQQIDETLQSLKKHLSIDAPMGGEQNDFTMMDMLSGALEENAPDLDLMKESLRDELNIGLSKLSPREAEILSSFYGLNDRKQLTVDEISKRMGYSKERVRQIRDRALRRLRRAYDKSRLRSYL